jgi:hypothetical protein
MWDVCGKRKPLPIGVDINECPSYLIFPICDSATYQEGGITAFLDTSHTPRAYT